MTIRIPATPEAAPIFIIANGRSGTTLMRFLLNAHPDIYIAEEICFHFWIKTLTGRFRQRLHDYFQSFSYAWLRMDPQVVLDTLPHLPEKRDTATLYTRILQCKAAQHGKKRFGEKGPLLVLVLNQLFQDYPDARIIHMVRDPRGVVHSHTTMPWSTNSLLAANRIVQNNMKLFSRYDGRVLSVKLEDLIANPEPVMRTVLDFIGVEWSNQVLHHTEHLLTDDGIPFPWLVEASERPKHKKMTWQEALSPAWIRIIEKTHHKTMSTFGYVPMTLNKEPTAFDKILAISSDLPRFIHLGIHMLKTFTRLLWIPKSRTQDIQMLMHSSNPDAWDLHPEWNRQLPSPPPVRPPQSLLT